LASGEGRSEGVLRRSLAESSRRSVDAYRPASTTEVGIGPWLLRSAAVRERRVRGGDEVPGCARWTSRTDSVGRGGRALDPAGSSRPRAQMTFGLHETVEMVLLDDSPVCPIHPQPEPGGGLREGMSRHFQPERASLLVGQDRGNQSGDALCAERRRLMGRCALGPSR